MTKTDRTGFDLHLALVRDCGVRGIKWTVCKSIGWQASHAQQQDGELAHNVLPLLSHAPDRMILPAGELRARPFGCPCPCGRHCRRWGCSWHRSASASQNGKYGSRRKARPEVRAESWACGRRRTGCPANPACGGYALPGSRYVARLVVRAMARRTYLRGWFTQHRVILRAMRIVATEAGDAAGIHQALHEIVALHAVLVRRAVGEMGEGCFAQLCSSSFQ